MSRINTNVSSLVAQNNLSRSNANLSTNLERLSTGLRINRGADDPSGLIVSERLRSEMAGVTKAISNSERAANVLATTEAALAEVSSLLISIKGLTIEAANTGAISEQEIEANQLQIDSAIESITRISNTASFAGLKLLNGSLDFLNSGVDSTQIQDVKVYGANFGTASTIPVTVEVLNSAEVANLYVSGGASDVNGDLLSSVTFEIQGTKGAQVFTFTSGTNMSAIMFAVNRSTDSTGVEASLVSSTGAFGSGLKLHSTSYGSDEFVSIKRITGGTAFKTADAYAGGVETSRDTGVDVLSLVNGNLALGDGTSVSLRTTSLNIEMDLTVAAATTNSTNSFTITGGGARYQIGSSVESSQQVGFGVQSVAASRLGSETLGFLNSVISGGTNSLVADNAREASNIIDKAIDQVAVMRGRIGAFEKNTLRTSIRSQQIALENLTSSESKIRDTDFAAETAAMTRNQILVQAGTQTLGIANASANAVLSLLQG